MTEQSSPTSSKRSLWISIGITAGLLVVFYTAVWVAPPLIRAVFSRSIDNYDLLAKQAIERGDPDAAVEILERAAREIPREVYFERPEFMYDWIGRIRKDQGKADLGLAAFLRAQQGFFRNIRLRGYLPPPRLIDDIVEAYFLLDNPAGAYNETRVAMDFYPTQHMRFLNRYKEHSEKSASVLRDLAALQIKARRLAEARTGLIQALATEPTLPEAHYWIGRLLEVQGKPAAAVPEYEQELTVNPFNENAVHRLSILGPQLRRRVPVLDQVEIKRKAAKVAEFLPEESGKPLASLFGLDASLERKFEWPEAGPAFVNIAAHSTPFDGIFGWVEIRVDDRHLQNLYLDGDGLDQDGTQTRTYSVFLGNLEAGAHTLRIENLSDGRDENNDRNTFIHSIRVFRAGVE